MNPAFLPNNDDMAANYRLLFHFLAECDLLRANFMVVNVGLIIIY